MLRGMTTCSCYAFRSISALYFRSFFFFSSLQVRLAVNQMIYVILNYKHVILNQVLWLVQQRNSFSQGGLIISACHFAL